MYLQSINSQWDNDLIRQQIDCKLQLEMVDSTQRDRVHLTDENGFSSLYGEVVAECVNDVYIELFGH